MAFNPNFNSKASLIKPVVIVLAVLLAIGGGYALFNKKSDSGKNDEANKSQENPINPSGLDSDKRVKNVEDVEEVVTKWIEANPQAIINSVSNMQKKAMEEQMKNAQKNIAEKKSEIYDENSPSFAPKDFDVTIVEFYDYHCGYCKKVNAAVEQLLKSDTKVKIIYKDFPILGQSSEELSKVSIAVYLSDNSSFRKFHNKLMSSNAANKDAALKIAKDVGIDVKKLENTLSSQKDKIMEIINKNRSVGSQIGIQGTPAFIIGDELVPGAIDAETLKSKVNDLRKK